MASPVYTSYKLSVQLVDNGVLYYFDCQFPENGWRTAVTSLFGDVAWEDEGGPVKHMELIGTTLTGEAHWLIGSPHKKEPRYSHLERNKSLLVPGNNVFQGFKNVINNIYRSKQTALSGATTTLGAAQTTAVAVPSNVVPITKAVNYDDFPVVLTL